MTSRPQHCLGTEWLFAANEFEAQNTKRLFPDQSRNETDGEASAHPDIDCAPIWLTEDHLRRHVRQSPGESPLAFARGGQLG